MSKKRTKAVERVEVFRFPGFSLYEGDRFGFTKSNIKGEFEVTGKTIALNHPLVEGGNALVIFFKPVSQKTK